MISVDEALARLFALCAPTGAETVPLRRAARADEIAKVCRFLASADASIITGATLVADGGSSIVDVPTLAFTRLESAHAQ